MKKVKEKNRKIIVIKIGTFAFQNLDIKKIVKGVVKLRDKNKIILVSSGAVGEGRKYLKKNNLEEKIKILSSKEISTFGQAMLIEKYIKEFRKYNILAGQILISKKVNKKVICNLLKHDILPIINGNDAEVEEDLLFNDNDSLAGEVAMKLKADKFVILTDIDAVYDLNPNTNKDAKKYKILTEISEKLLENSKSSGQYGTGGMYTKLKIAERLLEKNIETYISNSFEDIERYLSFEECSGTVIKNK